MTTITFMTRPLVQHGSVIRPIYLKMKELGYDVREGHNWVDAEKVVTATKGIPSHSIYYQHGLGFYEKKVIREEKAIMYPGSLWVTQTDRVHKVVGWCKSDILFSPRLKDMVEETRNEIGFRDPWDKTVLLAPSVLTTNRHVEALAKATEELGMNLIIKTHGNLLTKEYGKGSMDLLHVNSEIQRLNHVTCIDPQYPDITNLFPLSDITFSTGSSVLWEFLVTGKPSVDFLPANHANTHPFGTFHVPLDLEALKAFLTQFLDNPGMGKEKIEEWSKQGVIYKPDGHATDRAIEFILEVFQEDKTPSISLAKPRERMSIVVTWTGLTDVRRGWEKLTAEYLAKRGHQTALVSPTESPPFTPDVVLATDPWTAPLADSIASTYGVNFVVQENGTVPPASTPKGSWYWSWADIRESLDRASTIVAVSKSAKKHFEETYTPKCPLIVSYQGVDDLLASKYLGQPKTDDLIWIGPLEERKRPRIVLDAVCETNMKLTVIGNDQDNVADDYIPLGKDIHFLGPVSDEEKFRHLSHAKCLIAASEGEEFFIPACEMGFFGGALILPSWSDRPDNWIEVFKELYEWVPYYYDSPEHLSLVLKYIEEHPFDIKYRGSAIQEIVEVKGLTMSKWAERMEKILYKSTEEKTLLPFPDQQFSRTIRAERMERVLKETVGLASQSELIHGSRWDILIILDACRPDFLEDLYPSYFRGKYRTVRSAGCPTVPWFRNTFKDRYLDTIYLSANPYIASKGHPAKNIVDFAAGDHFYRVEDLFLSGWDDALETVPPKAVTDAIRRWLPSGKRIIAHFMQPHGPYVGETKLNYGGFKKAVDEQIGSIGQSVPRYIWPRVDSVTVRRAYRDNLLLALKTIKEELGDVIKDRRVVITSDHGEELWENGYFGHTHRNNLPRLRDVPWLEVEQNMGASVVEGAPETFNLEVSTVWADMKSLCRLDFCKITYDLRRIEETYEPLRSKKVNCTFHWSRRFEYPWVLMNAQLNKNDVVMDAGGGRAHLQFLAAPLCNEYHNFDLNEDTLSVSERLAREQGHDNMVFTVGDLTERLPYPEGHFDKVICISTIEHIIHPMPPIVDELIRVLKPGGLLLLTIDICQMKLPEFNITEVEAKELCSHLNVPWKPAPPTALMSTHTPMGITQSPKVEDDKNKIFAIPLKVLCFKIEKKTAIEKPTEKLQPYQQYLLGRIKEGRQPCS